MRVLVTGAGGQLGHDTVAACTAAGDTVYAFDHSTLDVSDRDAVLGAITSLRPDAVIHCAAWTAVDACESDPAKAFTVNALAVRWVAEGCHRVGAHLVHISTDYVFDGTLQRPYHEWDTPNPQSVYGLFKLAGEREALALGPSAAVVRTSWVCGEHGNNMVKTVLRFAAERPTLSFVTDQVGHPTFTADLAPMLRRLAVDRRSGVHHLTNAGSVSWHEFVQEIVRLMGKDPAMVLPILTSDLDPPRPAPRPANSVLDNAVARLGGLPPMRDFREPLAELVSRLW
ncbi:MAG: dTDP-4-dehydrorhamnose reductase [Actinomycetota bacterium]